ncbi:MAG TPA: histidine kinase dimerization/phospho-acceptor domain-containing protein [Spirochaetia bacterium]|nr:histidine kinase dimerization/phospho-acceptor domain-containing protein [Spirochaetia bacterium]
MMLGFAKVWHRLTDPPRTMTDPEQRRRMHLLLSILTIMWIPILQGFLSLPFRIAGTVDVVQKQNLSTVFPFILLGVAAATLFATILARKDHYSFGARAIVTATSAMAFVEIMLTSNILVVNFPIIAVVLCSVLLSPLDTVGAYAITIAGCLIVPAVTPGISLSDMNDTIVLATIVGGVSLAASVVHRRDLKQIEAQTAELARNSDRILGAKKMEAIARLSSGLAHEFNNIMTAIRANAQLIESMSTGNAGESAKRIHLSTVRAARLTEGLLSFSEQQLLEPTTVDIDEVMKSHKQRLKAAVRENVSVHLHLSDEKKILNIDVELVCEAIQALVRKAQENIPGHGSITIRTKIADLSLGDELHLPAGAYCSVTVSNSGPAASNAGENRVFEPFFTTGEFGTGDLYLAAAYGTVRQSGGSVEMKVDPEFGAAFVVMIPRIVTAA